MALQYKLDLCLSFIKQETIIYDLLILSMLLYDWGENTLNMKEVKPQMKIHKPRWKEFHTCVASGIFGQM